MSYTIVYDLPILNGLQVVIFSARRAMEMWTVEAFRHIYLNIVVQAIINILMS